MEEKKGLEYCRTSQNFEFIAPTKAAANFMICIYHNYIYLAGLEAS